MKPWVIFTCMLCLASAAKAHHVENVLMDEPGRYQGTYEFEDGTRITGGRMDESGNVGLSYLDVWNVARGGIFEPSDDEFTALWGTEASIRFERDGEVMIWQEPAGPALRATRVMVPDSRKVEFANDGLQLSGTLYLPPERENRVPALVLAHGSGPSNRYLGPWVTFFVSEGYAVLAFDKRGTGDSDGDWQSANYFELAGDVVAAASWLADQPDIDPSGIGLKTSSQSGWYGPHAMQMSDDLNFLIQRAAPAVNIGIGTAHELGGDLRREGVSAGHVDAAIEFWKDLHELAQEGVDIDAANHFFDKARREPWFEPAFGDWDEIAADWWSRHVANMRLEPAATAATLDAPVLWFLAELDENVPYEASMAALRSASRSNRNLTVVTVHDAKHNFLVSDEKGGVTYTDEYWSAMAKWLRELHD